MSARKIWILFGDIVTTTCLVLGTFLTFALIGVMLAWRG